MTTSQINDSFISAMEMLATKLDNNTSGTLVIECTVVNQTASRVYNVKYLDGVFKAYSNTLDFTYEPGDIVYVLIPDKDFSKNKLIISLPFNREIE